MSTTNQCRAPLIKTTLLAASLLAIHGTAAAAPIASYTLSGYFQTPGDLQIYEIFSESTVADAELINDPYYSYSSFTLTFDVDEGTDGNVPLFFPGTVFYGAASNINLSIDGNPYWSAGPTEISQVDSYDPNPQSWSWSTFDGTFNAPDNLIAINASGNELVTLAPDSVGLSLVDTTRTLYPSSSNELIRFDGSEFTSMEMYISWYGDPYDEFGDPVNDYGGDYFLTGTVTSVSVSVSAVPIPAAVWLFGSGLLALAGVARARKD